MNTDTVNDFYVIFNYNLCDPHDHIFKYYMLQCI